MWQQILATLLGAITPALLDMAKTFALDFYKRAKETDNPFDDILAGFVCALLGVPTPKS